LRSTRLLTPISYNLRIRTACLIVSNFFNSIQKVNKIYLWYATKFEEVKVCGRNPNYCGIMYLEKEKLSFGSKIDSISLGINDIMLIGR